MGRFTLEVKGVAAHAGLDPGAGVSAVLEISQQIQAIFELNDPDRGITVNVGTVDGGLRPNVVAPEASAAIDCRVPTHADARRIEEALAGLVPTQDGVRIEVSGGFGRPPMEPTARNRGLWRQAELAAEALGLDVGEAFVGGGSDGNLTSQHTATLDGLGAVGGRGARPARARAGLAHARAGRAARAAAGRAARPTRRPRGGGRMTCLPPHQRDPERRPAAPTASRSSPCHGARGGAASSLRPR